MAAAGAALQVVGLGNTIMGQNTAKKGGGHNTPSMPKTSLAEQILTRGLLDVLRAERGIIDDAIAQGNYLQPEMYRALGLEPIYDEAEGADVAAASERVEALRERASAPHRIREELNAVKDDDTLTKREKRDRSKELRKELRKVKPKHINQLKKELGRAERDLEMAQAVPRRVIGVRALDKYDPSGSEGGAFAEALDLQSQALVRALKGEEPIDPTLKTAFEEREQTLREQLRRQWGSDFESSEPARKALSNFDREKAEAFAQFNREQIESLSGLSENRARALSDLTKARLSSLQFPVDAAFSKASGLSHYLGDALKFIGSQHEDRKLRLAASDAAFKAHYLNNQAYGEAFSKVGSEISSMGGSMAGAGGGGGGFGGK